MCERYLLLEDLIFCFENPFYTIFYSFLSLNFLSVIISSIAAGYQSKKSHLVADIKSSIVEYNKVTRFRISRPVS